jgi:hypothetical protein
MITLVAGDFNRILLTLKKNKSTFVINSAATEKASLVTEDRVVLAGPVTCVSTVPGADWTLSKVMVEFSSESTVSIAHKTGAMLEIQVDDGGKLTWFSPHLLIVQGTID